MCTDKAFFEKIDLLKLTNQITRFRRLDFHKMGYNELFNEIIKALLYDGKFRYLTEIRTIQKDSKLYRVRRFTGTKLENVCIKKVQDCWNPPSEVVNEIGRLNKERESLLYTSLGNPTIAMDEMGVQDGNLCALIVYNVEEDIKVNCIGMDYEQMGIKDDKVILVNEIYKNFLSDEFSREVGKGTEHLYRISEIIAKGYFDLPPRIVQDAWGYPSVKNKQSLNICFRPEIAREVLKLEAVLIVKRKIDAFYPLIFANKFDEISNIEFMRPVDLGILDQYLPNCVNGRNAIIVNHHHTT